MAPHVVHEEQVPARREPDDTVAARETIDARAGRQLLAQSVLHCSPGRSAVRDTGAGEEVLFVLAGRGALILGDTEHELAPETGAYLCPGERYVIESFGPDELKLVSVRILQPESPEAATGERRVTRRLSDQSAQAATTDREFRVVADPETGLRSATHFVGYIPAARAPDHFHRYDEVIYVLEGDGVMHMEGEHTPLMAGSCINLPSGTVHCLAPAFAGVASGQAE
jgi:mannose-6-phosphate isomerase-like protein (cupin superfamily)